MLTRRAFIVIAFFSLLSAITPARAHAQATGSLSGLVTDESGGTIPGATVEAKNTATGLVRTTVTGGDGFYSLPLLQPGRYSVKATLTGFKSAVREGIEVSVGDTSRADMKLAVGGFTEELIIVADP